MPEPLVCSQKFVAMQKSTLMFTITKSPNPADALYFMASVTAFIGEALSLEPQGRSLEISDQAKEGLCQLLGIVTEGLGEVYGVLSA